MGFSIKRYSFKKLSNALGLVNALAFVYKARLLGFGKCRQTVSLASKKSRYALFARKSTSDLSVFSQIFVELEYSCIDNLKDVGLILDCGANVGYSSSYFLSQFPSSKVICIEPDNSNFSLLSRNLEYFGGRVKLIHGGVWSHQTFLRIRNDRYRDGGKWAVQVEETEKGSPGAIRAVDIKTLLDSSGFDRISILKMDIEGAECIVFSGSCDEWISKVDNILIELHDDSVFGRASEIVIPKIMSTNLFAMSTFGELTIFKRVC